MSTGEAEEREGDRTGMMEEPTEESYWEAWMDGGGGAWAGVGRTVTGIAWVNNCGELV